MLASTLRTSIIAFVASGCLVTTAPATRTTPPVEQPPPTRPTPVAWDSTGWELLGEQWVEGKTDTDVIKVGRDEGRFTQLMVVVEESDLEMREMEIHFGNGEKASPDVRQFFRENSRTRAIDLPGNQRAIKTVKFKYGNLPGGGRAKVALWGKAGAAPVVTAPILKARWDSAGWELLGEQWVEGKKDTDIIKVGKDEGHFTQLMVVVEESDLEMREMEIHFGNGEKERPEVKQFFREDTRTRAIDLPGNARVIKKIKFKYGNLPGGGRAKVAVWGKAAPPPVVNAGWDPKGWTLLGEQWVKGKKDTDMIKVGKDEGKFTKLMVVVEESDLEMFEMEIHFGNGEKASPDVRQIFREGSRTRAIDLPGNKRFIKKIKFKYGNLPGGGRARVAVYGM